MWVFASISAMGVAAGGAGVVSNYHGNVADNRLSEIAGEVKSLGEQQQQASQQLAAVRSEIADGPEAAAATQTTASAQSVNTQGAIAVATLPATSLQPSQPTVARPVSPLQRATYSSPWPIYPQPVQTDLVPSAEAGDCPAFPDRVSVEPACAVSVTGSNSFGRVA